MTFTIETLLRKTVEDGASDLHLTVGAPPCYRLNGVMTPLSTEALETESLRDLLYSILKPEHKESFEARRDLDCSLDIEGVARFRVNIFDGRQGAGGVFRVIPTKIKTALELGLPDVIANLSKLERGLVLVTGPTGSGKSTTLAAIVDLINRERHGHILTIEDPIEFVHKHKQCIVNQREVNTNTESFSTALRAALREDPDVILVGEMRDLETISLAISAAETGHLVLGTLHTSSAAQTIDRVIDVFPPHQQQQVRTMLSESLQAVVSQQLMPREGGGRVAGHEIMLGITAIRNLIREAKTFQIPSVIETNTNVGMQTATQCVEQLLKRGLISLDTAIEKGLDPRIAAEAVRANEAARANEAQPKPVPAISVADGLDLQPLGRLAA